MSLIATKDEKAKKEPQMQRHHMTVNASSGQKVEARIIVKKGTDKIQFASLELKGGELLGNTFKQKCQVTHKQAGSFEEALKLQQHVLEGVSHLLLG